LTRLTAGSYIARTFRDLTSGFTVEPSASAEGPPARSTRCS